MRRIGHHRANFIQTIHIDSARIVIVAAQQVCVGSQWIGIVRIGSVRIRPIRIRSVRVRSVRVRKAAAHVTHWSSAVAHVDNGMVNMVSVTNHRQIGQSRTRCEITRRIRANVRQNVVARIIGNNTNVGQIVPRQIVVREKKLVHVIQVRSQHVVEPHEVVAFLGQEIVVVGEMVHESRTRLSVLRHVFYTIMV